MMTQEEFHEYAGKPALAQEHSDTSREAAAKIEPHRGKMQTLVYQAIKSAGQTMVSDRDVFHANWNGAVVGGLSDEEGIAITGLSPSTYRPRRVELVEQNRVRDSGLRRRTRSNRRAVVWEVVP